MSGPSKSSHMVGSTSLAKFAGNDIAKSMIAETVMASPITVTENAASTLGGSAKTYDMTSTVVRNSGSPGFVVSNNWRAREPARVDGAEATTTGVGPYKRDFMFVGQAFEVRFYAGASRSYRIWKDGQLVAAAMASGPATPTVTNQDTFLKVDFGARLTKPAHIVVEFTGQGGAQHRYLVFEPTALVAPPPPSPRVMWLADSFGAGTGATDKTMSYAHLVARRLGWIDNWVFSAVASTGVVATDSNVHKNYQGRAPIDIAPFNPDILIIQGSINDKTQAGLGTVGPALSATISGGRAPKTIVTSPLWMASGSADQPNFESVAAEMASTSASNGVPFIDMVTGNPYFYGTGKVGTTTGDGNADVFRLADGTHPSQAGHEAIAAVMAPLIAQKLGVVL